MNAITSLQLTTLSDDLLLSTYDVERELLERGRTRLGHLEQEILRRMREREAVGIPSDIYLCEVEQHNTYDADRLRPLLELLITSDLQAAYTPEHQETRTVPARWDVRRLLPIARRYGVAVLDIIESAKVPSTPHLIFHRKEAK